MSELPYEDPALLAGLSDRLVDWVDRLSKHLPAPIEQPYGDGFRWVFPENTAGVLLVAKSVRMVSAIQGARVLVDHGFLTEVACLIRIVGDIATEIIAIAEGEISGQRTKAQQDFIDQYFARPPASSTPGEAERPRYVGRDDLFKAHKRLSSSAGLDVREVEALKRTVDFGYDGYVHGSYTSAMELYHAGRNEFMMRGHDGSDQRQIYRAAVAATAHQAAYACGFVALALGDQELHNEIYPFVTELAALLPED